MSNFRASSIAPLLDDSSVAPTSLGPRSPSSSGPAAKPNTLKWKCCCCRLRSKTLLILTLALLCLTLGTMIGLYAAWVALWDKVQAGENIQPWLPLVPPVKVQSCPFFNVTSDPYLAPPTATAIHATSISVCWQTSTAFVAYELQRDDWWNQTSFETIYLGSETNYTADYHLLPGITYHFRYNYSTANLLLLIVPRFSNLLPRRVRGIARDGTMSEWSDNSTIATLENGNCGKTGL